MIAEAVTASARRRVMQSRIFLPNLGVAVLIEAYRHLATHRWKQSVVDLLEIRIAEFDGRRKAKWIHVAVENGWVRPFRFGDSAPTGTKLDRQRLRLTRSVPALIAVANAVDLELERLGTATLDCNFDIKKAESGVSFPTLLIEIDKGYPAIFAFASA